MGPLLALAFQAMPYIAKHGKDISALISAGQPIKDAVVANAPELWAIFQRMAPLAPQDHPDAVQGTSPDVLAETFAKQAFAPHMTGDEERAWMDRASQSFG